MQTQLQGRLGPLAVVAVSLLVLSLSGCKPAAREKVKLKVICAGSLMVPFAEMEKAYEALHPDVDVLIEGHGSVQVIRQVTELGAGGDVLAVADHSLIPPMMYDVKMPDSDRSYATWQITFAGNTLGLAYTPASRYADEIDASNWYEILSRPDVKLGISDPRFDACGYRALMACWLAGVLYDKPDLFRDVLGEFEYPVSLQVQGERCTIVVPNVVRPLKASVRGSSVVLLGILESGDIDYAFEYLSVARQRNLGFVELPPQINLASDAFRSLGYDLRVKIDYQRYASLIPEFRCQEILYGLTIPENGPHPQHACSFVRFMVGLEGQRIFAAQFQPLLPLVVDRPEHLPVELADLVQ